MRPRLFLVAALLLVCGPAVGGEPDASYRLENRTLHRIDPKLFGHFMERPSWGEVGIEGGLVPGGRELQPGVLDRLQRMNIPILRFPGGTDVDYLDWRAMVDHGLGKGVARPVSRGHRGDRVTNNFGYDEFLRLCERLESEALLVVNLADALLGRKPVARAALDAAGLVAYCNTKLGAALPDGMQDWPALRARNGRKRPYRVAYIQLGNETWFFFGRMRKRGVASPEKFYVDCLAAYIRAIREVDPTVRMVVDAISPGVAARIRKRLGSRVDYLVQHHYLPWGIRGARRDGRPVPLTDLGDEDVWYAWVAVPNTVNERGESILAGVALDAGRKLGYDVAITEWNWNGGYWKVPQEKRALDSSFAKAIGAAGYLHAFLRAGDRVKIACQAITVGNRWGITGIRADRAAKEPVRFLPTAQVTMFYSRRHGDRLLALVPDKVGPTYVQRLQMGRIRPRRKVAYLDCLATADDRTIYLHAINRHFSKPLGIRVTLSGFAGLARKARHVIFEGRLNDRPLEGEPLEIGRFREATIPVPGPGLNAVLPPRSVSCIEIPRGE